MLYRALGRPNHRPDVIGPSSQQSVAPQPQPMKEVRSQYLTHSHLTRVT